MTNKIKKENYINQKFNKACREHNIEVYDNQGKTIDKYTVIIDDAVFGMSDDPFYPLGVNQFCCMKSELGLPVDGIKRKYVPFEIKKAILNRLEVE